MGINHGFHKFMAFGISLDFLRALSSTLFVEESTVFFKMAKLLLIIDALPAKKKNSVVILQHSCQTCGGGSVGEMFFLLVWFKKQWDTPKSLLL